MEDIYEGYREYIKRFSEPGVFYHATRKEHVRGLLERGFNPERIGTGGGCQGGTGFSCTWSPFDARDWAKTIYGWQEVAILKISLPGLKLAEWEVCEQAGPASIPWGREQGYLDNSNEPTENLRELFKHDTNQGLASAGWALLGQYLLSQGYDGYLVGIDEVVIVNFDLLKAEIFALHK